MNSESPIGIFDSGIGGLTVAHAIREALPSESLFYFGDTAHLPYGDKSPASIRHYAARIAGFLLQRDCKLIVIACNTASAHALKTVQDVCGPKIPVVNVVDPVAKYVSKRFKTGKIGVIGTKGTISSRIYARKIKALNEELKVVSKATPVLAPMIEEGFFNNNISKAVVHDYLQHSSLKNIEALVLGCTHYPLIRNEVEDYYDGKVQIIDSAIAVAREVSAILGRKRLKHSGRRAGDRFYVSDYTASFERSTQQFFGERIKLKEKRIWE